MTNTSTAARGGALAAKATVTTIVAALAITGVIGPANADTGTPSAAATYSPGHPGPAVESTGTLPDGATWKIEKPANWNGTLLLFSHPMRAPGEDNPAADSFDPITGKYLLEQGYALAGSSYATTGFAIREALQDQTDVVRIFRQQVAVPKATIAWGASLGGAVTAGLLERHPELFDGGLPMCGVVAGGVGLMDSYLDTLFALKTLIAPDVQLVNLGDTLFDQIGALQAAIEAAQGTREGRAKIALAAAIGDFPGWAHADNPRPAPGDIDTQQAAQFEHMMEI
ncbi:MAG: prolyl oligopeptidase family serine peptidase, partial [Nakamurella sp.]